MPEILKIAANVTHPIALGAVALAILLFVLLRRRIIPRQFWIVIVVLVIGPIVVSALVEIQKNRSWNQTIYRVRVTVIDLQQVPVEDAKLWSSMGGEPKKVAGGWQFDIPRASKPSDGKLTLYASIPNKFLKGSKELLLSDDFNPAASIQLASDSSSSVRGIVVDRRGTAIQGARVSVVGYESEAVITKEGGGFVLPAHAAAEQQVLVHAEKKGFTATQQWHPAGDFPATIMIERR